MNLHSHLGSTRGAVALRWMLAVTACAALVILGSAAARPALAAAAAPNTQPRDSDQRNRQYQRAEALYLSGHLKEAAVAFEELTRAYPDDAHVWLKYGNTLTKQGSYDTAASAFQTALTLDPAQGNAALNLALVRLAQAQAALDTALARLTVDSTEHTQAEALQNQLKNLLGAPEHGASPH
jgi:tetratricopeptide (TPR) repeat protein